MTNCLELRKTRKQQISELEADHLCLVKECIALIDRLVLRQSDIARIKTRLRNLKNHESGKQESRNKIYVSNFY